MRSTPSAVLITLTVATLASGCFVSRRVHPRSAAELERGYALLEAGDPERAEVAFSHALAFDPDLVEGENGLGVVARSRGELDAAIRHFERALATDHTFAEGHANLGEALLASGSLEEAERSLREALALNPDLIEARHNLGRALLRAGLARPDRRVALWSAARREYLHALETDERRAETHAELALIDFLSGLLPRAEAAWTRAAELAPRDPGHANALCLLRAAAGRCRSARVECERCGALAASTARCAPGLAALRSCRER
jgi:tetratricopeptide (TPR) repeat protein